MATSRWRLFTDISFLKFKLQAQMALHAGMCEGRWSLLLSAVIWYYYYFILKKK
jgi:hypothetical protein